ncbi:MAG: IPT/TIG domain-containing protein [Verrucomicrobiia bacterium]
MKANQFVQEWNRRLAKGVFIFLLSIVLAPGTTFSVASAGEGELPSISRFDPASAPVGASVTIIGERLDQVTAVSFSGIAAQFQVGFSDTNLLAIVPIGASTGPVTLTTPIGTVTSEMDFNVTTAPPPVITGFTPDRGPIGTQVIISGTDFGGATAVHFNGVAAEFAPFGNTIAASVPSGATTGPITVVTPSGSAPSATSFVVEAEDGPEITGVDPMLGRPGTLVTISGRNLESATVVHFNGINAEFTVFGVSLLVLVPSAASTGPITVVTPQGSATTPDAFTIVGALAPEIAGFSPEVGDAGVVVSITGTNLASVTEVRFGGAAAAFKALSDTAIEAIVPEGATTGEIVLANSAGSAISQRLFYVPARIQSFTPATGAVGTSVTIRGASFTEALAVLFGGVNASFTLVSASEISAIVPEGAVNGLISIATPAGFASTTDNFFLPPSIQQFDPMSGLVSSPVTITGENLLGATSVRFAGTEAPFSPVSLKALVATVPAGAQNGPISVTTPGGTATSRESFFVGLFSDLAAEVAAAPDEVELGGFVGYTLSVTNRGPLEAPAVVVRDWLPVGTSLLFAPAGGDCTLADGVITCQLGSLPAGAVEVIRFSVMILDGQFFTNRAEVTTTQADPDLMNNVSIVMTPLKGATPPEDAKLEAALISGAIELSWPVAAGAFVLESTPNLGKSDAWLAVTNAPVIVDGKNRVTQSITSGAAFYRLRKP